MKIPRLAYLVLAVAGVTGVSPAAPLADEASANGYSRRLWRIEDGLPQNRIRALCQTPDGYLWIGTPEGLARFDGVRFTIFDQSNTPALHDDGITTLRLGHDGALWIGTEGGGLVQYKGGDFHIFGAAEGLTNGFVRAIQEDRRQTLWVGTDRGFFHLVDGHFDRLDGTAEVPLASVFGLGEDENGRIWANTSAGLLSVVDNQLHHLPPDCVHDRIRLLYSGTGGAVRMFGDGGVSRARDGCPALDKALPRLPLRSAIEDRDGVLWVGTMGEGLLRVQNGQTTWFKTSWGLPDNTINAMFEDLESNLWIGCEDGLLRLTKRSGTTIGSEDGLEDDDVLTVYPDPQDALWITTVTGKVYRVAGSTVKRFALPAPAGDLRVRTVFQDRGGVLWFGTAAGGVARVENGHAAVYNRQNGPRSNTVRQILQDRSGSIWLALDSGLSRWDGQAFHNYYLEDGLSYPSTRCMVVDTKGDVLVGTDAGLNRIHEGQIVRDQEFAALAKEKIWSIYQDSNGTLWLGTRGGGLLRFRAGKAFRFARDNGLLANTIFQILEDSQGKLWMSTPSGVISADRKELEAADDGSVPSIHVIPYGTADGMATSQMNGGIQPAGARSAAGDLWFATVKGAVRISPSGITQRHTAPLLIERITADDEAVPMSGAISLGPLRGRLAVDFTLCDLLDPQRVSFRYKLEPFDDKWTTAVRARTASYTNVPPGRYRFRVMASDAASAGVSEASVEITVRPSFYQTKLFIALLILLAGAAVWAGFALYARQTRTRYALLLTERARLAREMHDTVIQGCVGISTLLEAAERFRDLDPPEAEALLAQAREQATDTLEEARQAVWDLRNRETGESSIDMLFDLARKLGSEHGIQIETDIVGREALDPETDRTILLVGREALRNAVSHASPKRISLRIDATPSEVRLEVTDDGSGFKVETEENGRSSHFGVVGMKERVEKLNGVLTVVSGPGSGTKVEARIPLPHHHGNGFTAPQSPAATR